MAIGRIWPNVNAANAHINAEAADWIPIPVTYAGSGALVPVEELPEIKLAEPVELENGSWFVPDVASAVFANDTPARMNGRKQDVITANDLRRTYPDPPPSQSLAAKGNVG